MAKKCNEIAVEAKFQFFSKAYLTIFRINFYLKRLFFSINFRKSTFKKNFGVTFPNL